MAGALPLGRVLLTGVRGQVGGELLPVLSRIAEVLAPPRDVMDLADISSLRKTIRAIEPRWIINPAAYTAVDKAESESALAYTVNAEAVYVIGEEARAIGAGVIHFSTDYVFSGDATNAYVETDATGPQSVYGASKLAGEKALADSGAAYLVLRTSWVYGAVGKNFLLTILRLARERDLLRIVNDQHGAPTWSRNLATITAHIMATCEGSATRRAGAEALAPFGGIYHATDAGETTWYGFAKQAIRLMQERNPDARFADIEAIRTEEYPTPAKRPPNSRLNCSKLETRFGLNRMDWRESLGRVLAEL